MKGLWNVFIDSMNLVEIFMVDGDRTPASRRLPQLGASILVSKSRISADRGREMGTGRYFRGITYCDPVFTSSVFLTAPLKIVSRNYRSSPIG